MLFKQMNYFIEVVEAKSFTVAAEHLFVSQSAISQQMKLLEEQLGVALLHRKHRKFTVTPAGSFFYKEAKRMVYDMKKIMRETKRIADDEELQVTIGYLNVYNGQELVRTIAEFSETYPEVSIAIVQGSHEELYQELRQNTVDIVLSDQRRAFSDDYENIPLIESNVYIEISTRNTLSEQEFVDITSLRETPCILIANSKQQLFEEEFYRTTIGFEGTFLFAKSLEEARMLVIGNQGFLPIEIAGTLPEPANSIKRLLVKRNEKPINRNYCIFWKKERATYYIEEFSQLLEKTVTIRNDCPKNLQEK